MPFRKALTLETRIMGTGAIVSDPIAQKNIVSVFEKVKTAEKNVCAQIAKIRKKKNNLSLRKE